MQLFFPLDLPNVDTYPRKTVTGNATGYFQNDLCQDDDVTKTCCAQDNNILLALAYVYRKNNTSWAKYSQFTAKIRGKKKKSKVK